MYHFFFDAPSFHLMLSILYANAYQPKEIMLFLNYLLFVVTCLSLYLYQI